MKKRVLSSLIAITLTLSIITPSVFASENSLWNNVKNGIDKTGQAVVLKVNNKQVGVSEKSKVDVDLGTKIHKTIGNSKKLNYSINNSNKKKSMDELYKDAYDATKRSLQEKTQRSIKEARSAIAKLPKNLDWAIGEFSKQVDTVQHPIFVKIINFINKSKGTKAQIDINNGRELVNDVIEEQYKRTWSSELDKIQQEKINIAVNKFKNSTIIQYNTLDLTDAKMEIDDLAKVEYNVGVKQWINNYKHQIDNEVFGLKNLTHEYSKMLSKGLSREEINKVTSCKNIDELVRYLKSIKVNDNKAMNVGKFWASISFNIPSYGIKSDIQIEHNTEKTISQLIGEAKEKLNLGDLHNISKNLILPSKAENGVNIEWKSSNEDVISKNGKVTRPKASEGNEIITLTAILSKDGIQDTKTFEVIVKSQEFSDNDLVNRATNELTLEGNLSALVDDLKLYNYDKTNKVKISWKSNKEYIISNEGKVVRTNKDESVVLTAILSKGKVIKNKNFNIVVKAKEENIEKELILVRDSLEIKNRNNIVEDIILPTSLEGCTISWKSNNPKVVSSSGKVKRPILGKADCKVRLTAMVSKNGKNVTKDFDVIVKSKRELIANNKAEFISILEDSLKYFPERLRIRIPQYNKNDYNLEIVEDVLTTNPDLDYGKPELNASLSSKDRVEYILDLKLNYAISIDTMKREKSEVEREVQRIIKTVIKKGMTDVEKELALHDYIVKTADYNVQNYNNGVFKAEDHNAYGVLILHKGVCESYAKAMQLLLNAASIECKYVTGTSKYNGRPGLGHAWNMVKLDNEWYNLDATWDDPISDRNGSIEVSENYFMPVIHKYFNVTDEILNRDHIRGEYEEKNYPKCTGTKYAYENLDIDEYTSDGKLIKTVKSRENLDREILDALDKKKKNLILRIQGFKMSQEQFAEEVEKIAKGNYDLSWDTIVSDENHVQYNLFW
ncbi:immunoglobulin-like domain-containing protein [Hathewaya limosa]|uniref:23S rRNA pseudoU1915 N3-methylase RlmH n=1 Tax=Hathewaya limosa TaxID=1536 RepID=A0ABU0JUM6_HATLI|nr:immunoglobulin-like domain-containing protein [Hathewaya limosa]MDQ0480764.1 23S rRNA pseudoU1915 N3-methylase RlmH [Hathewaya limosa]